MTDMHTTAIGSVDTVSSLALVSRGEFVQLHSEVICSTRVGVPNGINTVGDKSTLVISLHIIIVEVIFIAPPAITCRMAMDLANLASDVNEKGRCTAVAAMTLPPSSRRMSS
jgi:hypothetical protein